MDWLVIVEKAVIPVVVAVALAFLTPMIRKFLAEKTETEHRVLIRTLAGGIFWAVERLARKTETTADDAAVRALKELAHDALREPGAASRVNKPKAAEALLERSLGRTPKPAELALARAEWDSMAERLKRGQVPPP